MRATKTPMDTDKINPRLVEKDDLSFLLLLFIQLLSRVAFHRFREATLASYIPVV